MLYEAFFLSILGTITVITSETEIVIYLKGGAPSYDRVLEGYYSLDGKQVNFSL